MYEINILDINDSVQSNVAEYEFIGADGAKLDNLGNKARKIRFKSYWFGVNTGMQQDPINPSYYNHYAFLNDVTASSNSAWTLTHPQYGDVLGQITNITIVHNDTHDYCEIDIDFTQDGLMDQGILEQQTIERAVEIQGEAVMNALSKDYLNGLKSSAPLSVLAGKVLTAGTSIADCVGSVNAVARNFALEADQFVNGCDKFLNSVTAPITGISNTINFAADIPGRLIGSVNAAVNRVMALNKTLSITPTNLMKSIEDSCKQLAATVTSPSNLYHANNTLYQSLIFTVFATSASLTMAGILTNDEFNRKADAANNAKKQYDANGKRINASNTTETLSITEIENALATCRRLTNLALQARDKENYALKEQAATLVSYVDNIKLNKYDIKTVDVTNMPMHILCMRMGQNYGTAERFSKLNNIKNPTFTEGSVDVYLVQG
jgi:hypothetical protein